MNEMLVVAEERQFIDQNIFQKTNLIEDWNN